jgi:hypothetical protein
VRKEVPPQKEEEKLVKKEEVKDGHVEVLHDNKTRFIPPVVAFSILDYLFAMDSLVNFEYRLQKLMTFSKRSIIIIHEDWGVPQPYNVGVFGLVTLIFAYLFNKILVSIFGRKSYKT